jgi:hypothetical protein
VKKALTVFFGVLLVWVQTMAMPSLPLTKVAAPCNCCGCSQTDCCVKESAPAPTSQTPSVPSRSSVDKQISIPIATPVLFVLSADSASALSPSDSSPLFPAGQPLYERHCALLI